MNTLYKRFGLLALALGMMFLQSYGNSNNKEDLPRVQGDQVPAAPSQLSAQARSTNEVRLTSVDDSNNESQFQIVRAATASGPFVEVGRVNANVTEFFNSSLSGNTSYYYRVSALNSAGSSPESAIGNVGINQTSSQSTLFKTFTSLAQVFISWVGRRAMRAIQKLALALIAMAAFAQATTRFVRGNKQFSRGAASRAAFCSH